jgi:hypothetical protein
MPKDRIISQSFLLVSAARSVDQVRRLLRETGPRYLVVAPENGTEHYLLLARDFNARVSLMDGAVPLRESGLFAGLRPGRIWKPADSAADGEPLLVFEDGMLAGVYDPRLQGRMGSGVRFGDKGTHSTPDPAEASARYATAEMPSEVAAGEIVVLAVQIGTENSELRVDLLDGSEIDIVIQAREGFAIEGNGAGVLRVPQDGSSPRLEFVLRATQPGEGLVRVFALHGGRFLGSLVLRPQVYPARVPGHNAWGASISRLRMSSSLDVAISFAADLSLVILESRAEGGPVLGIRVIARDVGLELNLKAFGPVPLRMEPAEYFDDFFGDIESLGVRGNASPEVVQLKLESKGARLFESLFPEELQKLLWKFRDRISSVQVYSDEPWIPWELCRLTGRSEDGIVEEGQFFCEAFDITRSIPGFGPFPRLTLDNMAVVVPRDSGLPAAIKERQFLLSLSGGGRAVSEVPARYVEVRQALAAGMYDGFHFSGHGIIRAQNPDHSAICLEDGDELRPDDISGVVRTLGRARPVVFLNSCHGGRGAFTLVGTGGWAHRYIKAGVGAFIGAYWSITDQAACEFARVFYRELDAGKPLASAVRTARLAIRSPDDPTWLAYTVYGEPFAMVVKDACRR